MKYPLRRKIKHSLYRAVAAALYRLDGRPDYRQFEEGWIDLTHHELTLPRLTPPFDGYRLTLFSDIHVGTWVNRSRLAALVEIVNHTLPDAVAITGDFISFKPGWFADDLITALRALQPREAKFAVLGNHDHWTSPRILRQVFRESGIIEVSNTVHTLRRGEAMLHFAGVDDVLVGQEDLAQVLRSLPAEGAAILLAHEPDFADVSAACGRFDLQLSGHTHGGQIVFPLFGPHLPPLGKKYPCGQYQIHKMVQYTTRGVGTSVVRLRHRCPPEIAVFTLRSPMD